MRRFASVVAVLFAALAVARAEGPKPPTAEEIMDRSAKAEWGDDYKALKSLRISGTISVPAVKMQGTMVEEKKAPNKSHAHTEIVGVTKEDEGYDGSTGWANDMMNGLRKKEGSEVALDKLGADFYGDVEWKTRYKKVTLKGQEELDGRKVWALTLEAEGVGEIQEWIDAETWLPTKMAMTIDTPQAKGNMETTLSDYHPLDAKAFPKVMVPGKLVQKMGPTVIETTFTKYEPNVELDDKLFAMPEEKAPGGK